MQAPPGAGKTTLVPLALADTGTVTGKILMLEPRRVAARAAADRLAALRGEDLGASVGLRMRGQTVPGTRIEVITDGLLTRMIQGAPDLAGVGAVIFDEFHERALQADLGLALAREIRAALRPDLALVAMSATLDAAPVAAYLSAPVVTSEGRMFPVETRWLDRPLGPGALTGRGYLTGMETLIRQALAETAEGDILAFLPGQGEIMRLAAALGDLSDIEVTPLYGALPFAAQRAALAPALRRKLVLATAIAETSVTIPGARVVVDGGRARRARLDPGRGMTRLVTERVTRAEADQRRGRAGRVAAGVCYRLWTRGEEGALAAQPPAEIEIADLVPLALELARWGMRAAEGFLTPPQPAAFAAARALLTDLGALDAGGGLTPRGARMADLPVHPRLARMLLSGGAGGPALAAVIEGRDPLRGAPADLTLRLDALHDAKRFAARHPYQIDRPRLGELRAEIKRLARRAPKGGALSPGAQAALAYPDRIALRRAGDAPRYLLSGGTGAQLDAADPLAHARLLVAIDLDGRGREPRIRAALPLSEAELRAGAADRIRVERTCIWSRRHRRVEARRQERLGALVLSDTAWRDAPDSALIPAFLEGIRDLGLDALNWTAAARALQARAVWVGRVEPLPTLDDAALLAGLEEWLAPYLAGLRRFEDVRALDLVPPLRHRLGAAGQTRIETAAPERFLAPTGSAPRIDYSGDSPAVEIRLQEVFGLAQHPVVAGQPLVITLLSPAGRPVQTTADLPGFWASGYRDLRKDMRGRYPKHFWPEDPQAAAPTRRAKPRTR